MCLRMNHFSKQKASITKRIFIRVILFLAVMCIMFFAPARTFDYWQAWVYLVMIFSCACIVILYFLKHDPGLMERRMRTREKVKEQKKIIKFGWFLFLPTFIIPGFDKYYGWSHVPLYLVIVSDILVLAGYILVARVFRENSYTSRIVEVDTGQKVISTGPYAVVRHPMYTGVLVMYGFTPLALGSYWALIASFFLVIIIILRLLSEEKFLSQSLEGYREYLQKVRYRIIPGIW